MTYHSMAEEVVVSNALIPTHSELILTCEIYIYKCIFNKEAEHEGDGKGFAIQPKGNYGIG